MTTAWTCEGEGGMKTKANFSEESITQARRALGTEESGDEGLEEADVKKSESLQRTFLQIHLE